MRHYLSNVDFQKLATSAKGENQVPVSYLSYQELYRGLYTLKLISFFLKMSALREEIQSALEDVPDFEVSPNILDKCMKIF